MGGSCSTHRSRPGNSGHLAFLIKRDIATHVFMKSHVFVRGSRLTETVHAGQGPW